MAGDPGQGRGPVQGPGTSGVNDPWVWVDGAYVRASRAEVGLGRWSPWDSFSLAESLPVVRGGPADLDAHLDRLEEGARAAGWAKPPRRPIAQVAAGLVRRNRMGRGGLRLRWWGGQAEPLLLAHPLPAPASRGPIRLMTSAVRHYGPDSFNARAKAGQMLANLLARAEVQAFAEDGLRLTPDGLVAEGVFSNVALLKRGILRTPPVSAGLLEGVTRAKFLARARKAGFTVREEPLTRFDLWTADRVWVLSSLRGALAVAGVDGRTLPAALAGLAHDGAMMDR